MTIPGTAFLNISPEVMPPSPEHQYFWATQWLTFQEARQHGLVVGSTGSGKTVFMRLLMQSVLPRLRANLDAVKRRAIIFDYKKDMLSVLAGMEVSVDAQHCIIMNPMDKRCHAWDVAGDISHLGYAKDFALMIFPENKGDPQPYFQETARDFLSGIIEAFIIKAPGRWTLRDVVNACRSREILHRVLASTDVTEPLLEHFEMQETFRSVKSALDQKVRQLSQIAAAWEFARSQGRMLRVADWINSESVLLLGNDEKARAGIDLVNRLVFGEVSKLLLSKKGDAVNDETWLFIDEMREVGRLDGLRSLLLRGRSKGVAMTLGFQDIEGVIQEYGEHDANEIIGSMKNLALLHLNATAAKTREWASQVLGEWEGRKRTTRESESWSTSLSSSGSNSSYQHSESVDHNHGIHKALLASELTAIPPASRSFGVKGVYYSIYDDFGEPGEGFHGQHLLPSWLWDKGNLRDKARDVSDYEEMASNELILKPWSADDYDRLGLSERISLPPLPPGFGQKPKDSELLSEGIAKHTIFRIK